MRVSIRAVSFLFALTVCFLAILRPTTLTDTDPLYVRPTD